jgi:hypothetical protein
LTTGVSEEAESCCTVLFSWKRSEDGEGRVVVFSSVLVLDLEEEVVVVVMAMAREEDTTEEGGMGGAEETVLACLIVFFDLGPAVSLEED